MKTRRSTRPSARACNSAAQIPCLDAPQGAVPSSGHFQLSSILLPLGSPRLCPPWSFQHVPYGWVPLVPTSWIWDLSASTTAQLGPLTALVLAAQHTTLPTFPRAPLSHCWGKLHRPLQTRSSWTSDPYCSHLRAANTKRDNRPFLQVWRTREAALAAKLTFPEAPSDAAVL